MRHLVFALVLATAVPAVAADAADTVEQPRAYDSLDQREKERELQEQHWKGPSGFWTSPQASKHGAYRYRMMGIGVVLVIGMGWFVRRLIKKANAERAARG